MFTSGTISLRFMYLKLMHKSWKHHDFGRPGRLHFNKKVPALIFVGIHSRHEEEHHGNSLFKSTRTEVQ